MKKIFALILVLSALLSFAACEGSDDGEPTYLVTEPPVTDETGSEVTTAEEETYIVTAPTLDEMSPQTMDVTMPYSVPTELKTLEDVWEIEAQDSSYPEAEAEAIYAKEGIEYYVFTDGHTIAFTNNGEEVYMCWYNIDKGLQFCSDDSFSWYFDDDHNIKYVAYTYYNEFSGGSIYTFYSPDGVREGAIVDGIYYDENLIELTGDDYTAFMQRYADTIEILEQ